MNEARPHVVIVGAGFGGLSAALALGGKPVDVTLIDKQNHHLFQPLLYQVATASLSPADIAAPVRSIVRRHRNIRVRLDNVEGVDPVARRITLRDSEPISYDWLVLATGARHSYFGNDRWERWAPGLKTIDDATEIRRNILLALERAEIEEDPAKRAALLTFVIIGGGPTGVEMAGAVAELARRTVSLDFRRFTAEASRIILVDSEDRLLKGFPERLSAKARAALETLGVEVRLGTWVTEVHDGSVVAGDEQVAANTIVWAAGVLPSPAARWIGGSTDKSGRAIVDADLRAQGQDRIFVVGDTAAALDAGGQPLPGVAPVAKQQGRYAARAILAAIKGATPPPFRYRDYGNLATIGRSQAVADFGGFHASGFAAWLLWCVAHIWFLIDFRSRITVSLNWLWNYVTYARSARLITGLVDARPVTITPREV